MTATNDTTAKPGTYLNWKTDLPQEDREHLTEKYGDCLEAVRTLDESELTLLQSMQQGIPCMLVQQQFRLRPRHITPGDTAPTPAQAAYGKESSELLLSPGTVVQKLRRFLLGNKALRTSYYPASTGQTYAVESSINLSLPTLTFNRLSDLEGETEDERLSRIMLADRHCPFDLGDPFLVRIHFYAISSSEYAVIVSQPLLIANRWQPLDFFASLLHPKDVKALPPELPVAPPVSYLKEDNDRSSLQAAWQRRLLQLSILPELPGYLAPLQRPKRLRVEMRQLEQLTFAHLQQLCPTNDQHHWIALLATLWGLTLQSFSKNTDVCFPLLLPSPDRGLTARRLFSARCPLPVRVQTEPLQLVRDLVQLQHSQLMEALQIGLPTPQEFNQLTGLKNTYNHTLSFQDFQADPCLDSLTGTGILASPYSISSLADDLRINFHRLNNTLSLEVTYYEEVLSGEAVKAILDRYSHTLELAPKYWLASCSELIDAALPTVHKHLTDRQHWMLTNILKKSPLLATLPGIQLKSLEAGASIYELPCNEVVQSIGTKQQSILLLLSGNVLRQRINSDGWLVPLNVIGPGDLVNELALLEPINNIYSAVISDKAVIVALPLVAFRRLLQQQNDLSLDLCNYLLKQLDTYQRLWLTT